MAIAIIGIQIGIYKENARRISMVERYKILWEGGQGELTEKKSRFIATTKPVESEEEALAFIESMRKKYWDARHNCFGNPARLPAAPCWMCFWEKRSTTSAW